MSVAGGCMSFNNPSLVFCINRVGQILMEHGERGYFVAKFRAESEFEKKNVKK